MSKLTELIESAQTVAVIGHIRPDGDDIGSCLGTYNYIKLNYPEKKVQVFLESKISKFGFLKGFDDICCKLNQADEVYDLVICQDISTPERMGDFAEILNRGKHSFCADHHKTNPGFCEFNEIRPSASSTSEVVYELLDESRIDRVTAECLYTGIVHDTGVFQYSCTSSRTMEIAGKLVEKGVNSEFIINSSFYQKTYPQIRAWGYAFQNSVLSEDKRCIYSVFTWKDMKKFGITSIELDGISSELRLVGGVDLAMLIYQDGPDTYKLSLRSSDNLDCSLIALKHGGGGHAKAAGCTIGGDPLEIAQMIIEEAKEQL
ncbi:MAG: DHH family phosphoesterase [Lachnospiraceae bacterium]|nr:DHH family phosphoesterase [Lachnospiraceae bacterium]